MGSAANIPGLMDVDIDEAMVRAHEMEPAHLKQVTSNTPNQIHRDIREDAFISPAGTPLAAPDVLSPAATRPLPKTLSVDAFAAALQSSLVSNCSGCCMQLRQHGDVIASMAHGTAYPGGDWTSDTTMNIASLSKTITAMAMVKLLNGLQINFDTAIWPYLPAYWKPGIDIGLITFRDLMTHKSGLPSKNSTRDTSFSYPSMKAAIEAGVSTHGLYQYANMNFTMCRILLSVLNGNVRTDFAPPVLFGNLIDQVWDWVTIQAFQNYVNKNIFMPAGVTAHLVFQPGDALAYKYPAEEGQVGTIDGDLTSTSGAAGWHMSVNQVLQVMGTFRRGGKIVTPVQAQSTLFNSFAVDDSSSTAAGPYYRKDGDWDFDNGQQEHTVSYYLPQDMELVVFANSSIKPNVGNEVRLSQLVYDAYAPAIH